MKKWQLCACTSVLALALWQGEAGAQAMTRDGLLVEGDVGGRIGIGGGTIRTNDETSFFLIGVGGIGYAYHERIAFDLDTAMEFQVTPDFELQQFGLMPGVRAFLLPGLYARGASVTHFLSPVDTGLLGGAGYFFSPGNFLEVSYIFWSLNKHSEGTIVPRLGISF